MTLINAVLVPADTELPARPVEIRGYQDIQALVGGTFDVMDADLHHWLEKRGDEDNPVHIEQGMYRSSLWCNDVGLIVNLPWNYRINALFSTGLAGDIVVTGTPDAEGETRSINPRLAVSILKASEEQMRRLARAVAPFN